MPGDDISRHDSFRLAPAPRLALEERTPWIRSISYREIASWRNGGWEQRNNTGRGRRGMWIHGRRCETTGTVEIPISTLRRAQYKATSTRNLQQTSELLAGSRPSRVSSIMYRWLRRDNEVRLLARALTLALLSIIYILTPTIFLRRPWLLVRERKAAESNLIEV